MHWESSPRTGTTPAHQAQQLHEENYRMAFDIGSCLERRAQLCIHDELLGMEQVTNAAWRVRFVADFVVAAGSFS